MSGTGKGRWGSFLQQAVAAAESRLDNILAEGEESASPNKAAVAAPTISATKADEGISRSASSSSNKPDRLQERLAKAIAAKNQAQRPRATSGASTNAAPSRTQSPVQNIESPRQSLDVSIGASDSSPVPRSPQSDTTKDGIVGRGSRSSDDPTQRDVDQSKSHTPRSSINSIVEVTDNQKPLTERSATSDAEAAPRFSIESNGSNVPKISIDSPNSEVSAPRRSTDAPSTGLSGNALSSSKSPEEYEILLSQLQSDFETSELQKQEEMHGYIERIDALQSKLQYLSKESAESARRASISAPAGSLEKKLAEKEEQVALLMEEGQKLSKTEMKYLTTVKKLRAKQTEDSKEIADARKQQERAEKELAILSERLERAEMSERRSNEKSKLAVQLQREVDSLKIERDSKDSIIADLRAQLETNVLQEMQAETYAVQQTLEAERKRVAELEDRVSDLNLEKSLVADRAQTQIKEMKDKMAMEAERSRVAALEAQTEQQMLESKLEIMRARAEEVSSGATGDAQAKLLRQIETLQTQYAVASENWQGIEASLVARASSLEKERDEATRREADIRKKAREVTLKAKRHEEELEEARSQLPTVQQEAASQKAQIDELRRRSEVAESALAEAKVSFEREKESLKVEMQQRTDEESQKLHEDNSGPGSFAQSRAESPGTSTRRGLTTEFLGLQNLQMRRAAARSVNNDIPSERFLGRRPSAVAPPRSSGRATPSRQDSNLSLRTNGDVPDAPSIHTIDHDEFFERTESPTSQHHTINDMISVSTAAAGPSVQLVERMSSAVRRLESEKAATKEELARLSAQRDEARAEIVALMREVDSKRAADNKIADLEAEIKDINSRYQTTLEMLGEKSELVEELQSDIIDLKAMYRELVERTVK